MYHNIQLLMFCCATLHDAHFMQTKQLKKSIIQWAMRYVTRALFTANSLFYRNTMFAHFMQMTFLLIVCCNSITLDRNQYVKSVTDVLLTIVEVLRISYILNVFFARFFFSKMIKFYQSATPAHFMQIPNSLQQNINT